MADLSGMDWNPQDKPRKPQGHYDMTALLLGAFILGLMAIRIIEWVVGWLEGAG